MIKSTVKPSTLPSTKPAAAPTKNAPAPTKNAPTPTKKAATPTKKAPTPSNAPPNVAPTAKPVKPVLEPVKPVKEAAQAIDTQIMKEKQEQGAALKPNGNKPAVKKSAEEKPVKDVKDVVFAWTHQANSVQITGSFNDWKEKLDMTAVGDKHEVSIPLRPGKYAYKFIVDGEWFYDFTTPNECDADGNVNNVITV